MAVYNKLVATTVMSTDALFREYGKFIADSLESIGWALQADSGDLDWATVARETVTAFKMSGYEVRKSGTAGGTALYMKIQYGAGYNTNCLGIKTQFGTGFDGAGTLTGALTSLMSIASACGADASVGTFTVAGNSERWTIGCTSANNLANNSAAFFQRTCDTAGADTSTGLVTGGIFYTDSSRAYNQYSEFVAGAGTVDANFSTMYYPRMQITGGAVPDFPIFSQALTNSGYFMIRDMLLCPFAFAPLHSIHTVNHYGSNLTFKAILGTTTAAASLGWAHPTITTSVPGMEMSVLMRID